MANDLTGLNAHLDTLLREPTVDGTWTSTEKNNVLTWAVDRLKSRWTRPLDPSAAANQITMLTNTFYYNLPTGMTYVSRVDYVDQYGNHRGPIGNGSWEVVGDYLGGTGKLHVAPSIVTENDVLWLNGWGYYDTTTNLIPDHLVPLVLALARAELYRRLVANRENYTAWLSRNQNQNISINEMLQMVGDADKEARHLWDSTPRTPMKPVPGRVG